MRSVRERRSKESGVRGNSVVKFVATKERVVMCQNRFLRRALLLSLALGLLAGLGTPSARAADQLDGDRIATNDGDLIIHPINHATLVIGWKDKVIYVDPVGGEKRFDGLPKPNLILITDIHGDHLNAETLEAVTGPKASIVAPSAVAEKLPEKLRQQTSVLANGESKSVSGVTVEAVPMYNLTADRLKYHNKGRGNGYVVVLGGKRVYLSGDTEDIPEMRALKNIDVAFVCMNLPYTMTVEQAAGAVREFKPKIVYPYHYRGSDTEKFKKLVGEDSGEVRLRD